MFNLFSQSKAQIMVINNHELRLFVWKNKTLHYISSFVDTQDDHEKFAQVIIKNPKFPVIIITNFMEESFLNETIAHVSNTDHKALIERKLGYAFRKTPYKIAKVTDRELDGRRDDKILMSALTKPELLQPWVDPLLSNQIPIQSITSSAYLAEAFAQSTNAGKEDHLLIVNIDLRSELRQTYLKKGKIIFSRLTPLESKGPESIAETIQKESNQIRTYLERIRTIPYNATLKIQVYSPFKDDEFLIHQNTNELNSFENCNIDEHASQYSFNNNTTDSSAIRIFIAHTLQKKKLANTYAPFGTRRYYHLNTISRASIIISTLLVLTFALTKIPTLTKTLDNWDQQQQIIARTAPLTTEYEVLTRRFPETPIPSTEMALMVENYESILTQSYAPDRAMGIISQALSISPELILTRIHWEVERAEEEQTNNTPSGGFGFIPRSVNPASDFQQAILDQDSALKVEVHGLVFSPSSYRDAQNQVLAFSTALENFPGVTATPTKMPTDVRLDISVQTTVNGEEVRAEFALELIIEAPQ